MRINAIEEYGLRCLLTLARRGPTGQMTIMEVARAEGLSEAYVSKLLSTLKRSGLVKAMRGRAGGFTISRPPGEITLYEGMTALGGSLVDKNHCRRFSGRLQRCIHAGGCSLHQMLSGLSGMVQNVLSKTTLQDILDGSTRRQYGAVAKTSEIVSMEMTTSPAITTNAKMI